MSGRKTFVGGDILLASELNGFLMDQAVMVFDDASARTTAIPTPTEGMVTYLKDSNRLEKYDGSAFRSVTSTSDMPAGSILQVVSTTKTDTFTTSSTSFVDLTGLSVSITPSSASSKVLVSYQVHGAGQPAVSHGMLQIVRDSTAIAIGDASGSRTRVTGFIAIQGNTDGMEASAMTFLDSPATTSATTYKMQVRSNQAGTTFVNRSPTDTDASSFPRAVSTITVMEVAA